MLLACAAAFALWSWWTSFDSPSIYPRPHPVMWDVVSLNLRAEGVPAGPGTHNVDGNPLVRFAAWTMRMFGGDYRAIVVAQLPFLFLLLASAGFAAWRWGGALAGAAAPWAALIGPMSIGLSVCLDDLLMLQSMITAAMALLAWSDVGKRAWLAAFIPIPLAVGAKFAVYFSNALFFLLFFACGAGSWLAWKGYEWFGRKKAETRTGVSRSVPIIQAAGIVMGIFAAWMLVRTVDYGGLVDSAMSQRFSHLSFFSNPKTILSGPAIWRRSMAGPALAATAVIALIIALAGKKRREMIPAAGWLFVPMIFFSLLPKRNDFYLITAVPATYVIIATGLAELKFTKIKAVAMVAAFALMGNSWFAWVAGVAYGDEIQKLDPLFENVPQPYLVAPLRPSYYDVPEVAKLISMQCSSDDTAVIFAEAGSFDGWAPFYIWHENPSLVAGDINASKIPQTDSICLVGRFDLRDAKPYTAKQLASKFREAACADTGINPQTRRLDELMKNEAEYKPMFAINYWGIFRGPGIRGR